MSSAVRDDYMVRTIYSAVHTLQARREIIDMTDRSSEDQKNKPNDPAKMVNWIIKSMDMIETDGSFS